MTGGENIAIECQCGGIIVAIGQKLPAARFTLSQERQ